ncbi:MAG: GGDEF domain-containing protein, partial [Fibromonadales bacterium]|nr:GGDEF domain-containing protein [Fibromonadales bacterium]
MDEMELEISYRRRVDRAVQLCLISFCIFRVFLEWYSGSNLLNVAIISMLTVAVVIVLLLLQKANFKILPFIIPFFFYLAYIAGSLTIDSFRYVYDVYLLILIIAAAYFNVKSYLAFVIVTQLINLFLSIFVLGDHASSIANSSGDALVHFTLLLAASVMLFVVLYYTVKKSNEVDSAFAAFGALMRVTPSVLILVDKDSKIKYLSKSVSKILDIKDPSNFLGRNFLELFVENSVKEFFKDIVQKRSFFAGLDYQKITVNEQVKTFDVFADKMSGDAADGMFFMLSDVSEIVRLKELAEQDSLMDSLIQISNRRALDRQILQEWNRALRDKVNLSFLMIDIDFFKNYNDTYGHRQGDELLRAAGRVFKKSLKRSTDFIARFGGEEFAVLLYATNSHQANVIAERIRRAAEEEIVLTSSGEETKFTISIGVATLIPSVDMEYGCIIESADKALYEAKRNGRNKIWIAEPPKES